MALVGVQTWNQQDLIAVVSDADTLLDNFHAHLRFATEQFDSAMLITLVMPSLLFKVSFFYVRVVVLIWMDQP